MLSRTLVLTFALLAGAALPSGCSVTSHSIQPSTLGTPSSSSALVALLTSPGPIAVESINAADWLVPRSGLLNLDHPKAKAAHLTDGDEPIQIYYHVLRHPQRGTFVIDTGLERALRDHPEQAATSSLVRKAMHLEKAKFVRPLGDWVASQSAPPAGILLTHLHLDHIAGMPDVPAGTPIYSGPGEASARGVQNLFTRGTANRQFAGQAPIGEWQFQPDPDGRFAGVIDVLGDGSLFAILVPGHTPGSTAYLARTPDGPVLFTGDTCHTAWGWREGVEPGSYTADQAKNADSLARLRKLATDYPTLRVRLGHQSL